MRLPLPYIFLLAWAFAACDGGGGGAPPENGGEQEEGTEVRIEGTATITVHTGEDRSPISPYVYGSNQDRSDTDLWTVRRLGGNRLTGYNWETNHSNAGSDWEHSSDNFLLDNAGIPESEWDEPATVMTHFHGESLAMGAETMLTLQMAGYVAADDAGTVPEEQTAPSVRWDSVEWRKEASFVHGPDREDGTVYMDELVHRLTQRYGGAEDPDGVRWYTLDNEPALWPETHPRIHPEKTGAEELVERSVELASAVKAVDPNSRITGPVLYGFGAYRDLQGAPGWNAVKAEYDWFIDYYLDRMWEAEQTHGQRLLDVLDVHWYPEARGDHRIVASDATTPADVEARLQAPRTLWDSTYTENSWIADCCREFLPLLPRLQQAIDEYYPGTKLAITEYDYGAKHTISGGLAQADVLGAFGKYGVDVATLWGIDEEDDYAAAAFHLYRDYDGAGGTYGNTSVRARTDDRTNISVYASIEDENPSRLHIILINKNREGPFEIHLELQGETSYIEGEAWYFDADRSSIGEDESFEEEVDLSGNSFSYVVPRTSATHLVLRANESEGNRSS
jgi:mannan endo-1,4-beta-mannosidase